MPGSIRGELTIGQRAPEAVAHGRVVGVFVGVDPDEDLADRVMIGHRVLVPPSLVGYEDGTRRLGGRTKQ